MAERDERSVIVMPKREGMRSGSSLVAMLKGREGVAAEEEERGAEPAILHPASGDSEREISQLSVASIDPSPHQTREFEEEADLAELAASIAAKGILQPILVRPSPSDEGRWELVAGERRLRAARLAGKTWVPAIVLDLGDREAVEISIVENAQREELNPIEEALAYRILITDFRLNQTEVAEVVGKNRTTVANALRLLQLEEDVVEMLRSGEINAGHGRALLRVKDPKMQVVLARKTAQLGLSVRTLETLAAKYERGTGTETEESEEPTEEERQLERLASRVSSFLGLERVVLRLDSQGRKRLNLVFETEASWKRFVSRIRD